MELHGNFAQRQGEWFRILRTIVGAIFDTDKGATFVDAVLVGVGVFAFWSWVKGGKEK